MEPGASFDVEFTVRDETGEITTADALPTAFLVRNGLEQGTSITVVQMGDDAYRGSGVFPGGWERSDAVGIAFQATVAGKAIEGAQALTMGTTAGGKIQAVFYIRDEGGAPVVPDTGPTVTLIRNGVDQGTSVTVTQVSDGGYAAAATVPISWVLGDALSYRVVAALGVYSLRRYLTLGALYEPGGGGGGGGALVFLPGVEFELSSGPVTFELENDLSCELGDEATFELGDESSAELDEPDLEGDL